MGVPNPTPRWARARRPILHRLMENLDCTRKCWIWTGALSGRDGRGYISIDGKNESASRIAFKLFIGPIPEHLNVLHSCDNPSCCRPSHLHLGTHSDNMKEAYLRKRKSNSGANNPRAKITPSVVKEIRKRYPKEGGKKLAKEFGLDRTQPYRIFNRITWKHVH